MCCPFGPMEAEIDAVCSRRGWTLGQYFALSPSEREFWLRAERARRLKRERMIDQIMGRSERDAEREHGDKIPSPDNISARVLLALLGLS